MLRFILSAALVLGMGSAALASELDNESGVTNKELQGTLVLRVNTLTKESAFVQTDAAMASKADAQAFALSSQANFAPVPTSNIKSELDQDGGASSWYFYYPSNGYYNPGCNWYGNYYNPYYSYSYGYYNYYYYGSYWSYWR